ncbi:hypothetical protein M407DRAFT_245103 [Tulasnella calospora MUT 4182]|uniref:Uncharacterized protein n=1 Tax=Tulasnella calospora MUT 4182 TaxID=1051891 RepID=A0A0C3QBP1_9AGAM|nr:hypothetical protein M407DRAFT_245103 [Tulasnella calospora MUT 4182]
MVQSLLKSLFLYSALAASAVLAAPAHQHQSEPVAQGVSHREYHVSPHPLAGELPAPNPVAIRKPSQAQGGGHQRVTNAMRIAKGLPPLAPRKLYDGSRVGSAHTARSSPVPVPVPAVLVYGPEGRSGSPLGYLSQGYNGENKYYITTDCKEAMVNAQLFAGDLKNPAQPQGYSNVGLLSAGDSVFHTGTSDFGFMVGMTATPNGPPVLSGYHSFYEGDESFLESNVWSLNADGELILTWINPNGDAVRGEIGWYNVTDAIIVSADLSVYRSEYIFGNLKVATIRLYLADQFTCASAPI